MKHNMLNNPKVFHPYSMTRSISLLTQHTDPFVTVCFLSTYTVLTSYRYVYGIDRVNFGLNQIFILTSFACLRG